MGTNIGNILYEVLIVAFAAVKFMMVSKIIKDSY